MSAIGLLSNAATLTPPPDGTGHFNMNGSSGTISSCSGCGNIVMHPHLKELQQAQSRISELEEQIQILTLRATSAMEKATEYETSLRRMNSMSSAGRSTPEPSADATRARSASQAGSEVGDSAYPDRPASRLARLLPTRMPSLRAATSTPSIVTASPIVRKQLPPPRSEMSPPDSQPSSATAPAPEGATPSPPPPPSQFPLLARTPPTPTIDPAALMSQLSREQERRRAAEAETSKTKSEIEELTGQLFEQANEMVATERKARARLEARVEVLERRDGEKARRLGLLESRVQRVERVRSLLAEGAALAVDRGAAATTTTTTPPPLRGVGVRA